MKKYILLLAIGVILVSSCSLKPVQGKKTFIINPQVRYHPENITNKTIGIKYINCGSRFNSTLFFYRNGRFEFKPYAYAGWIESPCDMVKLSIINAIAENKMFKLADNENIFIAEDYELLFSIEDLEPVFEKNNSYILTNIHFTLIDKDKNNILNAYDFKEKLPIKKININNIVYKINMSIRTAINHMFMWMDKDLN